MTEVSDYRAEYEAEVEAASEETAAVQLTPEALAGTAHTASKAAIIESASLAPESLPVAVETLLGVLGDHDQPASVRLSALRVLKAAAFQGPRFAPHRADYLRVLRENAVDPAEDLREGVLEALAIEKDPYAYELLVSGLKDAKTSLVPLAKAIQLLSYDVHSDVLPLVRGLVRQVRGAAREEGLRLLAADPGSERLFTRLFKDKSEQSIIRRLSATGLQTVNPQAFARAARQVIQDEEDYNEIRATSLSALTHAQELRAAGAGFVQKVAQLNARSPRLRTSIRRFMNAVSE